jgi:RNA ligase (TIGR02306 family)
MAELRVDVVEIADVLDHPNADRLDIIKIVGMDYVCISQKGNYTPGDLAFYFPVDSVLPDKWVEEFGIKSFYSGRIRAARLRGIFSEGLLIPVSEYWPKDISETPKRGAEVTGIFGVTKYEPVIPVEMAGQVLRPIGLQEAFDSPEHFKKYNNLLVDGEEIVITEKLHGTNFCVMNKDNVIFSGSHNNWMKDNEENSGNVYVRVIKEFPELTAIHDKVHLIGEIVGVQDLKYGCERGKIQYAIFAAKVDGRYLNYNEFQDLCNKYKIKMATVLYRGPYSKSIVEQFNLVDSVWPGAKHMMEGVVVQPVVERTPMELNKRLVLKYISERYSLRKSGTENK